MKKVKVGVSGCLGRMGQDLAKQLKLLRGIEFIGGFDLKSKKNFTQPSKIKTCGSTFKNISKDIKAWMLIKEAGCDQYKEGDAVISKKHCNFFVNEGNAKSSDIEKLIKKVKKRVLEKTGKNLELEIKIIGE